MLYICIFDIPYLSISSWNVYSLPTTGGIGIGIYLAGLARSVHSVHRLLPPVSHLALTNLNCSRECRVFGSAAAVCIVRILAVADRGD